MRNFLLPSLVGLAAFTHAEHELRADLALGLSTKTTLASIEKSGNAHGDRFVAPSVSVGLSRAIAGSMGVAANISGDWSGLSEQGALLKTAKPRFAVGASCGLTYQSGDSKFFSGPAVHYSIVELTSGDNKSLKVFDGFGAHASISHKVHEYVGVRVNAQHIINKTVNSWDNSELNNEIGTLKSNVSQLGVALYTDFSNSDLNW